MNPLRIAEQLRTDYLQLLTTTFAPRQERLKRDLRTAVEREGFLSREPFVSLALPYQDAPALTELLPETRERFDAIAENGRTPRQDHWRGGLGCRGDHRQGDRPNLPAGAHCNGERFDS
jgi:hypothetical protein